MLAYFPTPYPDELWYSVLCRYHVRSGNSTHATTRYELFGNERRLPSIIAVNPDFNGIFDILPDGFLDKREIIDEHTLIPYLLRFANSKRRADTYNCMLGDVAKAPNTTSSLKQWSSGKEQYMRYCPLCTNADIAEYGEMYWHRSHQITLIPICPVHRCLLVNSTVPLNKGTGERFSNPTIYNCPPVEPHEPLYQWQLLLADTLMEMLTRELSPTAAPKAWSSTLFTALQNAGVYSSTTGKVDPVRLLGRMRAFYGEEVCSVYFPAETISANARRITRTGTFSFPEQYALISVMLGLPLDALTMGWIGTDNIAVQMKAMAASGYLWKKSAVAERLGVRSSQLGSMARQRGITPFWLFSDSSNSLRQDDRTLICVKTMMTAEMKAMVEAQVEELGIANTAEYIRYCIRKDL